MIPLMKSTFLEEEKTKKALAKFIMNSRKLSMGEKCEEFESQFAKFQGCEDAILFNSGGSANLAIIQTLLNLGKLKTGDKIGFSALTWSTNVMPIIQLGLVPVAIDCDLNKINVTSETIKETIKKEKINGFFATNVLGLTGDLKEIKKLCEKNNIVFFEDNCESLGTELNKRKAGNFGIASSCSFFVAHHMSTIEGGMVCTNDTEVGEMLRIVRANGWDRNLQPDQQIKWRNKNNINSEFQAKYTFYDLGYNLRPTEITGFLGIEQLKYLEENIQKRENNFREIINVVNHNPDFIRIESSHLNIVSSFAFPFLCKTEELRNKYLYEFSGAGIEIRPMIAGNIEKQPFYKKYVSKTSILKNTDIIHSNGFYCGNYPELTKTDLNTIKLCVTKK
jgi:CDP-6-deoxy-D-xylo-4-hexulose-3-dehydrase